MKKILIRNFEYIVFLYTARQPLNRQLFFVLDFPAS